MTARRGSRRGGKPSLATRFFLFLAIVTGALVAAAYWVGGAIERHADAVAEEDCAIHARLAASVADEHVSGLGLGLEAAADNPRLAAACRVRDIETARTLLRRLVSLSGRFDRVFLADTAGVEWCDYPQDSRVAGKSFAYRQWYRWVRSTNERYVSPRYARAAGKHEPAIAIAVPVDGLGGKPGAYLVAQVLVSSIEQGVKRTSESWKGTIRLFDRAENYLVPQTPDSAMVIGRQLHDLIAVARKTGGTARGRLGKGEVVLAVADAPSFGGIAVATMTSDDIADQARRITRRYRNAALIGGAAVSILALVLLR
ncbi:MAG TPA: cache domain-containing protein [Candidatus Eisenbacteria bacterium]